MGQNYQINFGRCSM